MRAFVSPYHNPFLNLALEDHFLRGGADLPVLFLYVNRPCVVLGRFQNPWLETNLSYLVKKDIWLVRRQSGGGCVFHDEGNLNFSFITPDAMINRRKHAEVLQEAFKKADIHLEISPRHDLWLDGRKISGSAFKQTKFGSFHHGTFLVSSNLDQLEESLKHTLIPTATKSIASVRSKVITLQEKFPGTEINDVIEIISHHLKTVPHTLEGTILSEPQVQESFRHLRSWEWLFGETPHFEYEGKTIHKGLVDGKRFELLTPDFSEQHRSSNLIL
ncbi:MAG: biotin/lipoate A/B protein ligase family protein [Bacteriovoracaceae bacterium]